MFHLVYASTAVKAFSSEALLVLLQRSRAKNARLDITGFLLYKNGSFMQALEGEETVVRDLFATIAKEPRHRDILTLVAIPVPKRQFPDWSMGFQNLDGYEPKGVPGYKPPSHLTALSNDLPWKESIAVNLLATFTKGN